MEKKMCTLIVFVTHKKKPTGYQLKFFVHANKKTWQINAWILLTRCLHQAKCYNTEINVVFFFIVKKHF